MDFPQLDLNDFNYELPRERIAEYPIENREMSKLLLYESSIDRISHHLFKDIPDLIPDSSLLILNVTKVIAARLLMQKETGGIVKLLLIEPIEPSINPGITLQSHSKCIWKCFCSGRKIRQGLILQNTNCSQNNHNNIKLTAKIINQTNNEAIVEFSWEPPELSFTYILDIIGKTPLPPYIKREPTLIDRYRYQTEYARNDGSVAAPTAGLHFTNDILDKIKSNGKEISYVTLHVGPGTFVPITSENISEHNMHFERIYFPIESIKLIYNYLKYNEKSKIIATGTTSLRAIESLYWFGVKLLLDLNINNTPLLFPSQEGINSPLLFPSQEGIKGCVSSSSESSFIFAAQFEPYNLSAKYNLPSPIESIEVVLKWMETKDMKVLEGETQLFIVPGYDFKIVNGLITNYHLPKSTLILLVAAFLSSNNWRRVYNEALDNSYRFLSYGDSSFLIR